MNQAMFGLMLSGKCLIASLVIYLITNVLTKKVTSSFNWLDVACCLSFISGSAAAMGVVFFGLISLLLSL